MADEHFVVIETVKFKNDPITILAGVAHSEEEAIEIFNSKIGKANRISRKHNMEVVCDSKDDFEAISSNGYYIRLTIHIA